MAYTFIRVFAVIVIVAFARLQVAFAAFAVFVAFTTALFFALVADARFVAGALAVRRTASCFVHALVIADFLACTAAGDFDARSGRRAILVRRAIAVAAAFRRRACAVCADLVARAIVV